MHEPFPWARRLTNIFNADAYDEDSGYTWTYLAIAMIGNFLVVFLGLLVFGWLRRVRPWWYSSKRLVNPEAVPADDLPNDTLFGWFFPLMRINEEEVLRTAGHDVVMMLRFTKMLERLVVYFAPYAFFVLLPIFVTSKYYEESSDISSFFRATASNVEPHSPRLWASVVGMYLITVILLFLVDGELNAYQSLRYHYLRETKPHRRTVVVEAIPGDLRSAVPLAVYFTTLYPKQAIAKISITQPIKELEALVERREAVMRKIEHELVLAHVHGEAYSQARTIRPGARMCGCVGGEPPVRALDHYRAELELLNEAIAHDQNAWRKIANQREYSAHGQAMASMAAVLGVPEADDTFSRMHEPSANPRKRTSTIDDALELVLEEVDAQLHLGTVREEEDDDVLGGGGGGDSEAGRGSGEGRGAAGYGSTRRAPSLSMFSETSVREVIEREKRSDYASAFSDAVASVRKALLPDVYADPRTGNRASLLRTASTGQITRQRSMSESNFAEQFKQPEATKAFVTFHDYSAAAIAQQVIHAEEPGMMEVTAAPEPNDIIWGNLHLTREARKLRAGVGYVLVALIIIFYIVPISLTYAVLSVPALEDTDLYRASPWKCARSFSQLALLCAHVCFRTL